MTRGVQRAGAALLLALAVAASSALAEDVAPPAAPAAADHLTLRYDHDSFFGSYPTVTYERPLASGDTLSGSLVDYLFYNSIEFDVDLNHRIGSWTVYPGLGVTFGEATWSLGTDHRDYIARDVVPQAGVYYASSSWEGEAYHAAWIPTGQESPRTALLYTQTRWWIVAKKDGMGLGPHLETTGTKEGEGPLRLTQLWAGGHFLWNLPKGSFQLFAGYDPISLASYHGTPKRAGAAFHVTFLYPLF